MQQPSGSCRVQPLVGPHASTESAGDGSRTHRHRGNSQGPAYRVAKTRDQNLTTAEEEAVTAFARNKRQREPRRNKEPIWRFRQPEIRCSVRGKACNYCNESDAECVHVRPNGPKLTGVGPHATLLHPATQEVAAQRPVQRRVGRQRISACRYLS